MRLPEVELSWGRKITDMCPQNILRAMHILRRGWKVTRQEWTNAYLVESHGIILLCRGNARDGYMPIRRYSLSIEDVEATDWVRLMTLDELPDFTDFLQPEPTTPIWSEW